MEFDTMQLDNVKRIEALRNPASAVYGANALLELSKFTLLLKGSYD